MQVGYEFVNRDVLAKPERPLRRFWASRTGFFLLVVIALGSSEVGCGKSKSGENGGNGTGGNGGDGTGGNGGNSCTYTGFEATDDTTFAHYDAYIIAGSALMYAYQGADKNNMQDVQIWNWPLDNGSVQPGTAGTVSLSGDNLDQEKCGACVQATRVTGGVKQTFRPASGELTMTSPSLRWDPLSAFQNTPEMDYSVTLDDVVLKETNDDSTFKEGGGTWCIDDVTLKATSIVWPCETVALLNGWVFDRLDAGCVDNTTTLVACFCLTTDATAVVTSEENGEYQYVKLNDGIPEVDDQGAFVVSTSTDSTILGDSPVCYAQSIPDFNECAGSSK